jgi:cathepsin X
VHALADGELARSDGHSVRSFSVQAMLNCGVGSCEKGGNPHDAFAFINKYGIPEEGCQHYQSVTPAKESCSAINSCASCGGNSIFKDNCTEVKNYKRWKIYNFGSVSGTANMRRELINHHALVCGIEATSAFKNHKGSGIFSETTISPSINHWVELVGEGTDNGTHYWLGRNSWGSAWGWSGFFKIKQGGSNLGIETKCYWAGDIS